MVRLYTHWHCGYFIVNFIISYFFLVVFAFKKQFRKFLFELTPYIIIGVIVFLSAYIYPEKIIYDIYISCILKILYITFVYIVGIVLTGQRKNIVKLIFR